MCTNVVFEVLVSTSNNCIVADLQPTMEVETFTGEGFIFCLVL